MTHNTQRLAGLASATLLAATLAACGGGDDGQPTVKTQYGTIEGSFDTTGTMKQFLGVPYATPPVGELRWKAPEPPQSWSGTRSAKSYGSHCVQPNTQPFSYYGTPGGREDCLYLNVYTPTTPGPHPVMVWIHGGAFMYGQSNGYVPTRLTQQGVTVVSINYRLGALGFLAHPALNDANGRSGNYGVMDQTLALRWVKDNIAAFGGDAGNITVAGQSAGAASVLTQLNTPKSAGLFHKAILQSAPVVAQPTGAAAQADGANAAATRFGCPNDAKAAACLRALPIETIIAKQPTDLVTTTNSPNVDGDYLVRDNSAAVAAGTLHAMPIMIGSTADEYTSLMASAEGVKNNPAATSDTPASQLKLPGSPGYLPLYENDAAWSEAIAATFGPAAPYVQSAYPLSKYNNTRELSFAAAITDYMFACGTRSAALKIARTGVPTYAYEFDDKNAPMQLQVPASYPYGAYHAAEIQYLFDLPSTALLTATQKTLSTEMIGYWSRFVKDRSGNPNAAGSSAWPAYSATTEQMLQFRPTGSGVITNFGANHNCTTLWAGV